MTSRTNPPHHRTTILTGFIMYVAVVNIPMRAQIANLYDEVKSGILLPPLMGATAVGSGVGGAISSKNNHTFWTLITASALMIVGCGLMSTLPATVSVATRQWGFEVILGFGIGMNLSTTTLVTSLNAEFQDFGAFPPYPYNLPPSIPFLNHPPIHTGPS